MRQLHDTNGFIHATALLEDSKGLLLPPMERIDVLGSLGFIYGFWVDGPQYVYEAGIPESVQKMNRRFGPWTTVRENSRAEPQPIVTRINPCNEIALPISGKWRDYIVFMNHADAMFAQLSL